MGVLVPVVETLAALVSSLFNHVVHYNTLTQFCIDSLSYTTCIVWYLVRSFLASNLIETE